MCVRAVEKYPLYLSDVSNHFKTQDMCDNEVRRKPWSLKHVPNWFVTEGQIKLWHDDAYYCNDNEMIEWYHDYQKRKAQKAKIKDELMPIAWHPSRWWDWCVPEDEERETEKIFLTT